MLNSSFNFAALSHGAQSVCRSGCHSVFLTPVVRRPLLPHWEWKEIPVTQPYSSHHQQLSWCGEKCFKFQSDWFVLSSCWSFCFLYEFYFLSVFRDFWRLVPVLTGSYWFWLILTSMCMIQSSSGVLYQSSVHFFFMCQSTYPKISNIQYTEFVKLLANISDYVFSFFLLLIWAGFQFIASFSLLHQFEPVITRDEHCWIITELWN